MRFDNAFGQADRRLVVDARMHEPRPLGDGPRYDRPVRQARVDDVEVLLRRRQRVAPRERGIDPVEEPGRDLRRDRDADAVPLATYPAGSGGPA